MLPAIVNKFNRGEIAPEALARIDVDKVNNCCSYMNNFMPMRLGPMMFRPGWEYLDDGHGEAKIFPFVAATDDTALLEFVNNTLYGWVDDAVITRTTVTTTITNGEFTTDISGWTDASGAGSSATWDSSGAAKLTGTGITSGALYQTFGSTETGSEHGLKLVIVRAPILVKIGTSGSGSSDIFEGTLGPGTHSLVFTPGAAVTLTVSNSKKYSALLDSVAFETTGDMTLPTSVATADLGKLRVSQSADIVFVACGTAIAPFKVERRGTKSWSVVEYRVDDGPFGTINNSEITLTPGALSGDTTLTASGNYFTSDNVGQLFKLVSSGQTREASVTAEDNGTGSIRVTGVGTSRQFTIDRVGTWAGTVTLQRSADDTTWEDVTTYTTNGTVTYSDGLDNSELYYRLWVKTGDYTSGTVGLTLSYSAGSIEGIGRVLSITSATVAQIQVLTEFGATSATRDWYAGEWSPGNGYPSAVSLHEGRLWWAGKNKVWGSVSDAYTSFDTGIEGDSASIRRTIGFGPVDSVYWLAPSSRLMMGLASDEIAIRSSSLGEVLNPTNTNLRSGSNQGSANKAPCIVDETVYFVQRSGTKIFALDYNVGRDSHSSVDLNTLHPDICDAVIKSVVFTRQPESRLYAVMEDGTARVYLFDPTEDVSGWSRMSVDGTIDDIVVLPDTGEDRVYAIISRGGTRRMCKMAKFSEAKAGTINKTLDFHQKLTSPGTTFSVPSPITNGETVYVWADGECRGAFTVASGQITVGSAWTDVVVGLRYTADYTSNKLADYAAAKEAAYVLGRSKRVVNTGLIARHFAPSCLSVGPSTALLKGMPGIEDGKAVVANTPITDYDELPFEFDGETETDPRIYIRATGPCTIMALTYEIKPSRTPSKG